MNTRKSVKICRLLVLRALQAKLPRDLAIHILSYRIPMVLKRVVGDTNRIAEYNPRGATRIKRNWRHPLVRSRRAYSYP